MPSGAWNTDRNTSGVGFIDDLFESSDDDDDKIEYPSPAAYAVANSRQALGINTRSIVSAHHSKSDTIKFTNSSRATRRVGPPPGAKRVDDGVDLSVSTAVGSAADSFLDWLS